MSVIDKFLSGVFTSYKEYIEYKALRDSIVSLEPEKGSSVYLSKLDVDEEAIVDSMIFHNLAVNVVKGTHSRDYCNGVVDAYEARRALIRKIQKKASKD